MTAPFQHLSCATGTSGRASHLSTFTSYCVCSRRNDSGTHSPTFYAKSHFRGGTVKDDELTSAQLRARHAIPSNSRGKSIYAESVDMPVWLYNLKLLILTETHSLPSYTEFSTSKKDTDYTGILVVAIIVVICGSILALFLIPMPVHWMRMLHPSLFCFFSANLTCEVTVN